MTRQNGFHSWSIWHSHPCRLVEERREEYVLPCPALPQLKFVCWTDEDASRAEEVHEFLSFLVARSADTRYPQHI